MPQPPVPLNYASSKSPAVSRGPYAQHPGEPAAFPGAATGPILEEPLPLQAPGTNQGPVTQPPAIQPSPTPEEGVLPAPPTGEEDGSAAVDPTTDVTPARYDETPDAVDVETAGFAPPLRLPPPASQ